MQISLNKKFKNLIITKWHLRFRSNIKQIESILWSNKSKFKCDNTKNNNLKILFTWNIKYQDYYAIEVVDRDVIELRYWNRNYRTFEMKIQLQPILKFWIFSNRVVVYTRQVMRGFWCETSISEALIVGVALTLRFATTSHLVYYYLNIRIHKQTNIRICTSV